MERAGIVLLLSALGNARAGLKAEFSSTNLASALALDDIKATWSKVWPIIA